MKKSIRLLFLSLLFITMNTLASEDDWNYIIGLSVRQLSLDVYEKGKTDPEGVLTENYTLTPELGLESAVGYFSDSNWGYKYAVNFGRFMMTRQEVDSNDVNLGTSADGYFLYAMPIGVYDFQKEKADSSLLVGFGIGLGYLNASGTIIFTESNPQMRHDFKFSKITYAFGLFIEHEIDRWSYGVSLYGPEVSSGGYEYNLFDFAVTVRRKIFIGL